MNLNNERFMSNFERLYDFYEIKNPPEVKSFIQRNEKLFDLLDETKIHLKDKFPDGTFELEMCYDLNGEGLDLLLVNIYVDEVTFNNGFTDKILEIDMKNPTYRKRIRFNHENMFNRRNSAKRQIYMNFINGK